MLFRSDHYPFLQQDISAIWWLTGFHPDSHQVTDTVEKINFEKMAKIMELSYLSGFEFADEQIRRHSKREPEQGSIGRLPTKLYTVARFPAEARRPALED